jgi:hypothetical protein
MFYDEQFVDGNVTLYEIVLACHYSLGALRISYKM